MLSKEKQSIETRKLQVSAGGSFFVVLPKEWSKEIGLKRGGMVNMFLEEDGSIRIIPVELSRTRVKVATLKVDEKTPPKSIDLFIKAHYMSGSDIVDIESDKRIEHEFKKLIKATVSELIGVEIADETSNRLSLRAIVDPIGFPLENIFSRVCNLSTSIYLDSIKALKDKDLGLVEDAIERSNEAMKLYRLIVRQLMLSYSDRMIAKSLGIENAAECIILAITARDVSRLIYHVSQIGRICKELIALNLSLDDESTISKVLLKLLEEGYKMVTDVFKAFLERNVQLASEIMDRMNEIRRLDEALTTEIFKNVKDIRVAVKLTAVIREIRRAAGHCVALADDTIFNETTRLAYQIKQQQHKAVISL